MSTGTSIIAAIVLHEALTIGATKPVIRPPVVALILEQKQQTATGVSEVREAGLRVPVLATPPGKDVTAHRREITTPASAARPVIGFVFSGPIGKDISNLANGGKRQEIEAGLFG